MRFLACVQYDGSNFFGFQRLNNERSVQKELEKILTKINKNEVTLKGAGRTDRGVHARSQMCHFDLDIKINESGLKKAMNSLLPNDIYINFIKKVDNNFHARFLVTKKIYSYHINMGEYNAIKDKYIYNYCQKLDIKLMKKAAKILKGAHSYKAFVSGERENYNSIIYDINFELLNDNLIISFVGTSFYRYMVRNLVGALIMVGTKKLDLNTLKSMLDNGKRIVNYMTVPSNGLYLEKIEY